MGHPKYEVTEGTIDAQRRRPAGEVDADERARLGLFLAFQRPVAIPGVKMADFLRHAATNVRNPDRKEGEELMPMREFRKELEGKMEQLRMDPEFARRYVNDGFSGGEMKRAEILQLAMLQPKFAILDETDSGLDADAVRAGQPERSPRSAARRWACLIITHHDKLLEHNPPDFTHVMLGGRIVETGGAELANELHSQRLRPHPRAAIPTRPPKKQAAKRSRKKPATALSGERCNRETRRRQPTAIDRDRRYRSWLPTFSTEPDVGVGESTSTTSAPTDKSVFKCPQGARSPRSSARSPR